MSRTKKLSESQAWRVIGRQIERDEAAQDITMHLKLRQRIEDIKKRVSFQTRTRMNERLTFHNLAVTPNFLYEVAPPVNPTVRALGAYWMALEAEEEEHAS